MSDLYQRLGALPEATRAALFAAAASLAGGVIATESLDPGEKAVTRHFQRALGTVLAEWDAAKPLRRDGVAHA